MVEDLTIYNRTVKKDVLLGLINKIKSKKELMNLSDDICVAKIRKFLMNGVKELDRLKAAKDFDSVSKSKEVDAIIKDVRRNVRGVYGLFQTGELKQAEEIVDSISGLDDVNSHARLLGLHVSTKERVDIYSEFYKSIFEITGIPTSIFELGCGYNPFSLPYMIECGVDLKSLNYIATDINPDDSLVIKKYFEKVGVNGDGYKLELELDDNLINNIHVDMCIALKLFDLVSTKTVEKIIVDIDAKWIIASFPTKTVTQIDMRFKRRAGFQKMLRRIGYKYQTITFENELIYVIDKTSKKDGD